MLTGDNRATASAVAQKLGIPASDVRAEVLPGDSDQVVRPRVTHITIDRDQLRWINEALVRCCERFAMGRSRVLLESLLKATGIGGTPPPRRSELAGGPPPVASEK